MLGQIAFAQALLGRIEKIPTLVIAAPRFSALLANPRASSTIVIRDGDIAEAGAGNAKNCQFSQKKIRRKTKSRVKDSQKEKD